MKSFYEEPIIEIIALDTADVITRLAAPAKTKVPECPMTKLAEKRKPLIIAIILVLLAALAFFATTCRRHSSKDEPVPATTQAPQKDISETENRRLYPPLTRRLKRLRQRPKRPRLRQSPRQRPRQRLRSRQRPHLRRPPRHQAIAVLPKMKGRECRTIEGKLKTINRG